MALTAHLTLGTRWTFVGGKGGVGKTTIAAALAVELADGGEAVTLLSTDPAHSLGDALGLPLSADPTPHPDLPALEAFELDAAKERTDFFAISGDAIATLIERGTYLDTADADSLSNLALPGMDELAALLRLSRLARQSDRRVIVDTAPTGHTLRLLDLPATGLAWLAALEAMQAKHDAVVAAFSRSRAGPDDASRFVEALRRDLETLVASFEDEVETRFVLVSNPQDAVLAETLRYREQLELRGIALGGIILNRAEGYGAAGPEGAKLDISARVPALPTIGSDLASLRIVARAAFPGGGVALEAGADTETVEGPAALTAGTTGADVVIGPAFEIPAERRLYLVGGKGGVGKSTVAAAIATYLAGAKGGRILLLSVDPAGSLSDVLAQPVGSTPRGVVGIEKLFAQQLDAGGAWQEFTTRYRDDVERLFEGLGGTNLSATPDREVLERLIDLAPPGVDELMAIMEVIDLLEDGEYDALVVDTAPTGHFLRLLELPGIALEWCHAMLRLLLKYRSVVRLEGAGERILNLSRSIRSLRGRLMDAGFTWVGAVALPETLSIPESGRLIEGLRRLGIEPGAVIVNRALTEGGGITEGRRDTVIDLLRIARTVRAAATPQLAPPPNGPASLKAFCRSWRSISIGI